MNTNPENGGVIKNRFKPESVAASSESEGHEIPYAFNNNPQEKYESTSNTITINMTFPTEIIMTGFGIINHNLTENASIQLKFYLNSSFTSPDREVSLTFAEKNIYQIIDDITGYKYIQLYIQDANLSTISFGVLYPGKWEQFPGNFTVENEEEFCVGKEVDTTDYGVHFESPGEEENTAVPEYTKLKVNFSNINREHYSFFKSLIRVGKKILIIDPTDQEEECYYGLFPDDKLPFKRHFLEGDTFSMRFWEDAIGVQNE